MFDRVPWPNPAKLGANTPWRKHEQMQKHKEFQDLQKLQNSQRFAMCPVSQSSLVADYIWLVMACRRWGSLVNACSSRTPRDAVQFCVVRHSWGDGFIALIYKEIDCIFCSCLVSSPLRAILNQAFPWGGSGPPRPTRPPHACFWIPWRRCKT